MNNNNINLQLNARATQLIKRVIFRLANPSIISHHHRFSLIPNIESGIQSRFMSTYVPRRYLSDHPLVARFKEDKEEEEEDQVEAEEGGVQEEKGTLGPLREGRGKSVEIEAKFSFTPDDEARLEGLSELQDAGKQTFVDVYFDHPDNLLLSSCDIWLRQREGQWQLKVPIRFFNDKSRTKDNSKLSPTESLGEYKELTTDSSIIEFLLSRGFIKRGNSLHEALELEGFTPLCELKTHRRSFKFQNPPSFFPEGASSSSSLENYGNIRGNLRIDLDTAAWNSNYPFLYRVGEIEVMVENCPNQIFNAQKRIREFAEMNGFNIRTNVPHGKVMEYLRQNNPQHYQTLTLNGVMGLSGCSKVN